MDKLHWFFDETLDKDAVIYFYNGPGTQTHCGNILRSELEAFASMIFPIPFAKFDVKGNEDGIRDKIDLGNLPILMFKKKGSGNENECGATVLPAASVIGKSSKEVLGILADLLENKDLIPISPSVLRNMASCNRNEAKFSFVWNSRIPLAPGLIDIADDMEMTDDELRTSAMALYLVDHPEVTRKCFLVDMSDPDNFPGSIPVPAIVLHGETDRIYVNVEAENVLLQQE